MGLFNKLFRRNKNNIEKDTNEINSNLTFKYKSGTMCEVEFSTMRELKFGDGNRKMVQENNPRTIFIRL